MWEKYLEKELEELWMEPWGRDSHGVEGIFGGDSNLQSCS